MSSAQCNSATKGSQGGEQEDGCLRVVAPCSLVVVHQRFASIFRPHHQGDCQMTLRYDRKTAIFRCTTFAVRRKQKLSCSAALSRNRAHFEMPSSVRIFTASQNSQILCPAPFTDCLRSVWGSRAVTATMFSRVVTPCWLASDKNIYGLFNECVPMSDYTAPNDTTINEL
jgi:hypothetical protein